MATSTNLKAATSAGAATKQTPADVSLTLSAEVLRVPHSPATRLVLAEIVSLHNATGDCYCSDAHFAARLTISATTASRAVQELELAGLIQKQVDKAAGNRRYLIPLFKAIKDAAATNSYPQNGGNYMQNEGRATRKMAVSYPQEEGSPNLKKVVGLPAKWGTNTTLNSSNNFQETLTPAASAENEIFFEEKLTNLPDTEKQLDNHNTSNSHTSNTEPNFEGFWQTYGKKKDEQKCLQSWKKLTASERLAAMNAVDAYVARTPELQYRKNPLNWLSGRCWLDEVQPLKHTSLAGTPQLPARATTSPTKLKAHSWR